MRPLTGKSFSEALLFAEHGENMLCTKIALNVRNNFCTHDAALYKTEEEHKRLTFNISRRRGGHLKPHHVNCQANLCLLRISRFMYMFSTTV